MCEIQSLVEQCDGENPAGLIAKMWVIPTADIDVFPDLKSVATGPAATREEKITLDGDITALALKAFAVIDIVPDSAGLKDDAVGPNGGKSWQSMLGFTIPKTGPAQLGTANCLLNACVVAIVQDKEGYKRVIGSKDVPAKIETLGIDTGTTAEDLRGMKLEIKATTGRIAPIYEGVIDEDVLT
jgi:hypothetical protein